MSNRVSIGKSGTSSDWRLCRSEAVDWRMPIPTTACSATVPRLPGRVWAALSPVEVSAVACHCLLLLTKPPSRVTTCCSSLQGCPFPRRFKWSHCCPLVNRRFPLESADGMSPAWPQFKPKTSPEKRSYFPKGTLLRAHVREEDGGSDTTCV